MELYAVYVRGSDGEFHLHAKARQEKKSVTHYNRLISKSPEEMARFFVRKDTLCPEHKKESCPMMVSVAKCEKCWLDWLNAEANEM